MYRLDNSVLTTAFEISFSCNNLNGRLTSYKFRLIMHFLARVFKRKKQASLNSARFVLYLTMHSIHHVSEVNFMSNEWKEGRKCFI